MRTLQMTVLRSSLPPLSAILQRDIFHGNHSLPQLTQHANQEITEDGSFSSTRTPSFSVYTEIALLAAQRLIIPVIADDFSREALKSLLHLIHGIAEAELPPEFKIYDHKLTFSYKSRTNGLRLPPYITSFTTELQDITCVQPKHFLSYLQVVTVLYNVHSKTTLSVLRQSRQGHLGYM